MRVKVENGWGYIWAPYHHWGPHSTHLYFRNFLPSLSDKTFLRGFEFQKFNTNYTPAQLTGDAGLSFPSTGSYVETGSQREASNIRSGLDEYIGLSLSFEGEK